MSKPDDIVRVGYKLFVGFQNGVGPQGQASLMVPRQSVVELGPDGHVIAQWDVAGKMDGLIADPALGGVIAIVNEDANSALQTIRIDGTPLLVAVTSYTYRPVALPHLGGTDAIAVDEGQISSAPLPGARMGRARRYRPIRPSTR